MKRLPCRRGADAQFSVCVRGEVGEGGARLPFFPAAVCRAQEFTGGDSAEWQAVKMAAGVVCACNARDRVVNADAAMSRPSATMFIGRYKFIRKSACYG